MKKSEISEILEILKQYYPDAKCSLNFETPFQLTVAVMLSAQCTDERVNRTTPELFNKYKTPLDFSKAKVQDIEKIIKPCGFHKTKAANIIKTASMIIQEFDGKVPENINELMSLPGIGRKSANVIMTEGFNNPVGIAVDTHAKRLANRIGLSSKSDPSKIEMDMLKIIPKEYLSKVNHLLMWHGRAICKAPTPKCDICPIMEYCKYYKSKSKKTKWRSLSLFSLLFSFYSTQIIL